MLERILDKINREIYRVSHPLLWGKHLQINGVPKITQMDKLELGKHVSINPNCYLQCVGGVSIGDNTTISYGTTILTSSLDVDDYIHNSSQIYRNHECKNVKIGRGVWLAANVTVLPGVQIADGIIVAAGSVVTKDLTEGYSLYAGNPAILKKKIR